MTNTTTRSLIDIALDAAFPGLPDGMTMDEARRRVTKAIAAVDWQIREDAAEGVVGAVRERIRAHGASSGDAETARAYEQAALGWYDE